MLNEHLTASNWDPQKKLGVSSFNQEFHSLSPASEVFQLQTSTPTGMSLPREFQNDTGDQIQGALSASQEKPHDSLHGEPIQESTRWSLWFPYSIGGPHKCAEMFAVFSAGRAHQLQNPAAFGLQNVAHSEHKAGNSAINISKNESSFERVKFALYWQYHIDQVIK